MTIKHILVIPLLLLLLLASCQQAPGSGPLSAAADQPPSDAETPAPALPTPVVTVIEAAASPEPAADASPVAVNEPSPETESVSLPAAAASPEAQTIPVTALQPSDRASAEACEDLAAFYADVTIPDDVPFEQSQPFEKVWRIRNEGTCTWEGYHLVWAGGSVFDAALSNPIPMTRPGELVDIPVSMRSPNQGGVYSSYWEFENAAGRRFGVNSGGIDLIWVRISVSWYPEGETQPGASLLPAPAGGCAVEQNSAYVDQLLALINTARSQEGLPPYQVDERLNSAAFGHSSDMACHNFVDHTGSDGSRWTDRMQAAGYSYSAASENIYVGNPAFGGDPQGAFDWWMNSLIHRNNILSTKLSQIGIGYAYNSSSEYKGYYTLNFGRP